MKFVAIVTASCFVALALVGCSSAGDTTGTAGTGSAITASSGDVSVTGRQYGALPVQSDVNMQVSYMLHFHGNGGSSATSESAEDMVIFTKDPLGTADDAYQVVIRNSNRYGTVDQYVVGMQHNPNSNAAPGDFFSGDGISCPNPQISGAGNTITIWSYDGSEPSDAQEDIVTTFELDKMIGGNWVPLMDPISGNPYFTPKLFDPSTINSGG